MIAKATGSPVEVTTIVAPRGRRGPPVTCRRARRARMTRIPVTTVTPATSHYRPGARARVWRRNSRRSPFTYSANATVSAAGNESVLYNVTAACRSMRQSTDLIEEISAIYFRSAHGLRTRRPGGTGAAASGLLAQRTRPVTSALTFHAVAGWRTPCPNAASGATSRAGHSASGHRLRHKARHIPALATARFRAIARIAAASLTCCNSCMVVDFWPAELEAVNAMKHPRAFNLRRQRGDRAGHVDRASIRRAR